MTKIVLISEHITSTDGLGMFDDKWRSFHVGIEMLLNVQINCYD